MPKSRKNIHHLNAGEWSPKVYNRSDHDKHSSACTLCRNAIPEVQGIVSKRTGLGLVAPAKFDDTTCRLLDFQFSRGDYAIIEVGEKYMRFFVAGDQIFNAQYNVTQVELTVGGDTIFTSVGSGIGGDREIYMTEFRSLPEFNNRWGTVESIDSDTFKVKNRDGTYVRLNPETAVGVYTTFGKVSTIYEKASPYLASEVSEIRYVQKNDVIWIVHPLHSPRKLIRLANDNWTLTELDFQYPATIDPNTEPAAKLRVGGTTMIASGYQFSNDDIGAYYVIRHLRAAQEVEATNDAPIPIDVLGRWTMETSGKWTGTILVQKQKFKGAVADADYITVGEYSSTNSPDGDGKNFNVSGTQEDVTRKYRIRGESSGDLVNAHASIRTDATVISGVVRITSITSSTLAEIDIIQEVGVASTFTDDWSRGAWRDDTGYPSVIAFYESRLWMGATPAFGNELWATEVDLFDSFKIGDEDTDGLHIQLNSSELNNILWIEDLKKLSIGTTGGEWSLSGTDLNRIISPTNIIAQKVDNNGSRAIDSARGGNSVFHVKSGGKMILEYKYDLGNDEYRGSDVTLFSSHLMQPKVKKLAFSSSPFEMLWALDDDGSLLSMTRDTDQKVYAWAKHETAGIIDDVTTIEGADGNTQLWATVKRNISGDERYFIEQMTGVTDYPNSQIVGGSRVGVPGEGLVEVMILIDTTGSMDSTVSQIKNDIESFVAGLDAQYGSRLRVGVIGFKDEDDNPVFDPIVQLSNWSVALDAVNEISVSGGGDGVENGFGAIVYAGNLGGWASGSQRIVSLWTDIESHSRGATLTEAADALNALGSDFYYNFNGTTNIGDDAYAYGDLAAEVDGATDIVSNLDDVSVNITAGVKIELGGARSERFTDCSVDCTVFGEFAYGLAHLEGETVWADADGFVISGVVTDGRLSLDGSFVSVKAGLQYAANIETMPIDADDNTGDITGYTKVLSRAYADLLTTNNMKYFDGLRWRTLSFRSADNDQTLPPEVANLQVELQFQSGHKKRFTVAVRSDDPLPFTLAGLVLHYDVTGE